MITCFLMQPTGEACRSLRRYTARDAQLCPVHQTWGHTASVALEPGRLTRDERGFIVGGDERPVNDDPRWPTQCEACGYTFADDDPRVLDVHEIFVAPDGRRYHVHPTRGALPGAEPAPAGAMWEAVWLSDVYPGPDGRCLMLRLPDRHDWIVDGPSRGGGRWTRSGTPPRITATPSIASPGYHGWLTDGVLTADLEGRSYG